MRDAVDATTPLSRRFVYTVEQDGRTYTVQGLVEDDFRYKLQYANESGAAIEEVVSDDAVAVRFLDPRELEASVDTEVVSLVDQETDVPGATVLDALSQMGTGAETLPLPSEAAASAPATTDPASPVAADPVSTEADPGLALPITPPATSAPAQESAATSSAPAQ